MKLYYSIKRYNIYISLLLCAANSNVEILQRYQSEILGIITNVPYVTNDTLHRDLKIPIIKETIKKFYQRYSD